MRDSAAGIAADLASAGDFPGRLLALAQASNSTSAVAVCFEQRIYDAIDHVSEGISAKIREAYANTRAAAAETGAAVGPQNNEKRPLTLTDAERRLCRSEAVLDHY